MPPFNPIFSLPPDVKANISAQWSQATPYTEQDRTARNASIFEGTAGIIRSIGDVYSEVRASAHPNLDQTPPTYLRQSGSFTGGVAAIPPWLLVGLALVAAVFLIDRR